MNTPFNTDYEIDLIKRLDPSPTNPYVMYNNTDRALNVAYRYFTIGNLGELYKKNKGTAIPGPQSFLYERATNVVSQNYWASTAILGVAYSAQRPDFYSSREGSENKDILGQLTLARSVINAVIETSLSLANLYRWRNSQGLPDPGIKAIPITSFSVANYFINFTNNFLFVSGSQSLSYFDPQQPNSARIPNVIVNHDSGGGEQFDNISMGVFTPRNGLVSPRSVAPSNLGDAQLRQKDLGGRGADVNRDAQSMWPILSNGGEVTERYQVNDNADFLDERNFVKTVRAYGTAIASAGFTLNAIISLGIQSKILHNAIHDEKKDGVEKRIAKASASLGLLTSMSNVGANFFKSLAGYGSTIPRGKGGSDPRWLLKTNNRLGIAGTAFGLANGILGIASIAPYLANDKLTAEQRGWIGAEMGVQVVGGLLQAGSNARLAVNVARGLTGAKLAGPLLGAATGALVVAMSPLEIYGLVQQSKYADKLQALDDEIGKYGYEGHGLLADLYKHKTGAESGLLAATTVLSVVGSAVSIASLVSVVGASVAIITSLATAMVGGILKGVQQKVIEDIAEDYAAKIAKAGGSFQYFANDLLAQHAQIQENAEAHLQELQSAFGVDSVVGVTTPLLSKQAMELAAITRNAADLKTAASYVDRFVDGKTQADQSLSIDPATGALNLGGVAGQKQLLTFLQPLLSSGTENRIRAKVGKDAYKTTLKIINESGKEVDIGAGGWVISDGAASSTMDLRKVISTVLSNDEKTKRSLELNVQGGAGDDVVIAGASAMLFDGGAGNNAVNYGSIGGGITVSPNSQAGEFTVRKNLTNTSVYQEITNSQDFGYGKRTETVEYRDYKLITESSDMSMDTLRNVKSIRGTSNQDNMSGDGNSNILDGRAGNDIINGGGGEDILFGGAGSDIVSGENGNDTIMQDLEAGNDTLNGGEGINTVDYSISNPRGRTLSGLTIDLSQPLNGAVTVTKVLAGTAASVNAVGSYIRIYHTSADWLTLALTELKVFVGGVNVAGGRESGVGADGVTVANDPRNNSGALTDGVAGGPRNYGKSNMAVVAGAHAYIELDLGSALPIDSIALWGVDGYADFGKDLRIYVSSNAFSNTATAYADLAANPAVTQIDLASVETTPTTTYTDTLIGIQNLIGTVFGDKLTGDAGPNMLVGGDGNDVLTGGAGNDRLAGGAGNDTVNAGRGDDVIEQDLDYAWDKLDGGDGDNDTVDYSISAMEGYIVAQLSPNQEGAQQVKKFLVNPPPGVADTPFDTLTGIENLVGTAMGDRLYGNEKANVLFGGAGNDFLAGDAGSDTLDGGDGDDDLRGGNDGDTLNGGAGQDAVYGENGNDQIVQNMDRAADTLNGGDGEDTVNYNWSVGNKTQNLSIVKNDDGTGTATKTFYGSAASIGQVGRYIRIYHSDTAISGQPLSLTGLKVYAGGDDVAAGKPHLTSIGSDDGQFLNPSNNNLAALTDGFVGEAYNQQSSSASNIVSVIGPGKIYIELDLGSVQDIDEIALWGVTGREASSNNLRVYVSQDPFPKSATAYADLAAATAVKRVDFGEVDTSPSTSFVDTLTSIENVTVNGVAMSGSAAGASGMRGRQFSALSNNADTAETGGITVLGDAQSNLLLGSDSDETFSGAAGDDTLSGGAGNDTLNGEAGNDVLVGGEGRDIVNGGDGDDLILQNFDAASETLTGGAGDDTVDYSITDLTGLTSTGIVADLGASGNGQGTVNKTFAGTSVNIGGAGRYIRIYHKDPMPLERQLSLTGMKVYVGGVDVAAGKSSSTGSDDGQMLSLPYNNPLALTDGAVGGTYNYGEGSASNIASVFGPGTTSYIQLDLGSVQSIDSISLWGVDGNRLGSNLRIYIWGGSFGSSPTTYAGLANDPAVMHFDVKEVDTLPMSSFTDTLSGIENLIGTALADTITGDDNANTLSAGAGNDVLAGGAGDDNLLGEDGNDILNGGVGGDSLSGGSGKDIVNGEDGDDVILQDLEAYVAGSSGVWDTLDGGDGVDTVDYSGTVFPGGTRPLMGGTGISADLVSGKVTRYVGADFNSYDTIIRIENVVGTALDDSLTGDAADNALSGDAGNDVLVGNAGEDMLMGGDGNDILNGGAGNDTLSGDLGTDVINGGDGDDMILQDMQRVNETLDGGDGSDTVDYSMTDLAGKKTTGIVANLGASGDGQGKVIKTLTGTSASVGATGRYIRIYHTDAVDVTQALALTGMKVFVGGVDVAAGKQTVVGADGGDLYSAIHNPSALTDGLVGGVWNLGTTNATSNLAHAGGIRPYIELDLGGVQAIDSIALWGRADVPDESDNLRVYVSNTAFPSSIAAYASLEASQAVSSFDVTTVDTAAVSTFTDTLTSVENLVGTALNDTLAGDSKTNALSGGAGDDVLTGGAGNDNLSGGLDNDTLDGGAGNDVLGGGAGADVIDGGDGDDQIVQDVDRDNDALSGGSGTDTVDYGAVGLSPDVSTGITANLATGIVSKVFAGTYVGVGMRGRYIRIYHTGAASGTTLSLTGMKVFAGGVDVAAGKESSIGADIGTVDGRLQNRWALTDGAVGAATSAPSSNMAWANAADASSKPYIELDLGSVQAIDLIALWGNEKYPAESNNLRLYVSDKSFDQQYTSPATAFADLAANASVGRADVAVVDTAASVTFTDTLSGIENLVGTALGDSLTGDGNANSLFGDAGNDTLDGGAGNDILAGGMGTDSITGGDGDDLITQDINRDSDTLNGGAGTDTVDYSITDLTGIASTGITANLATGIVSKVFAGTSVNVGATGRYIRIYHTDAASSTTLSLTGMKVFAGGVDVAAGKESSIGADIGTVDGRLQNRWALTDGAVGAATLAPSSNMAWANAADASSKPYIELDLGSVQAIDLIALWGNEKYPAESNNLRLYVSDKSFDQQYTSPATAFADLAANASVGRADVAVVDTAASVTFTDTLSGIENLVGTALGDNLTGDGSNNTLSGGVGNDMLDGGAGDDFLNGGGDNDILNGGAGNDTLAGGGGADRIDGGGGDDRIVQVMERSIDTLAGGNGNDTVDYGATDLTGIASTGITANLATGKVNKVFAGTYVGAGTTGRYIRIYHTDAVSQNLALALTGMKVFVGGLDVAAGKKTVVGADGGNLYSAMHNPSALTDGVVGGAWNLGATNTTSNLARAGGNKPYIELDLGSVQAIDSIALWGRADAPAESNNLRVYVSNTAFTSASYATLAADAGAVSADVAVVDTVANTTFTDTLSGIENLVGTALGDSLTGDLYANSLSGDAGNDTLDGGAGNDFLAGGAGTDVVNGGDGDDLIAQDIGKFNETLNGGVGMDTVDYSVTDLTGIASTGITANLVTGKVSKIFAGTAVGVGAIGRYIRIYHTDAVSATQALTLTGMKVFAGGVDVAAGKASTVGADGGSVGGASSNNPKALTDGVVGGAWSGGTTASTSNLTNVTGTKAYIQLDLGSVQAIDSIALWGHTNAPANSNNLRVYVSDTAFTSSGTTYKDLAANAAVAMVDVAVVDTVATTTFTDTLSGIESLVGTVLADNITGDGNANSLSGGEGNDTIAGGAGNDTLAGGAGTDNLNGGDGDDLLMQDMERVRDTLIGGAGIDTVDYSTSGMAGGIVANLADGTVNKVLAGTNVGIGATGRYIRIYHTDATGMLSLTGLKVYAGGIDVAANIASVSGADGAYVSGGSNNVRALTDGAVGGAWNNQTSSSNLALAIGASPYIELDLGSAQAIDSIALWGRADAPAESGNLRAYVSSKAFASATYATLAADAGVGRVDVAVVDTAASTTFTDTLSGIENLVGTALVDSLTGDAGNNVLSGGAGNDTLNGGEGNDVLDGGAGNDILAGEAGSDLVSGGDGDDLILQGLDRSGDTLNGGAGIDTVDYSVNGQGGGIVASLATGQVDKVFAGGTSINVKASGRYIRIYHYDPTYHTGAVSLTGMKVYAGGIDVAAGRPSTIGSDVMGLSGAANNPYALTDKTVGGSWNGQSQGASNLASAEGFEMGGAKKPYIELDLGSVQAIDSIALWGREDSAESQNLRIYVSQSAFPKSSTAYDYLASSFGIKKFDVWQVDTLATTFTDTLSGVENLVGTAQDDSLTGDAGNNVLSGGAGNDTLNGGGGADILQGGDGDDRYVFGFGSGQETIIETSGNDRIVFGAGISAAQVGLGLANGLVKLSLASGDSVTFASPAPGVYAVEQFEFSDGSVKDISWFNSLTNTAPAGANNAVALNEDGSYAVAIKDLGFTDANLGDSLSAVRIDSLPLAGALKLNGVNVAAAQVISAADLAAGRLVFSPTSNANGNNYASLAFSVKDQFGAFDVAPKSLTFNVSAVNDAPMLTGTKAVLAGGTEDTAYTITQASLLAGFSDVEGSTLSVLNLSAGNGTLSAFNATTKSWTFTPNANYNGVINLSYGVSDGVVSTPATQGFTLAAINDAPVLTGTKAVLAAGTEDTAYTITQASLLAGFSDVEGSALSALNLSASNGTLSAFNATTKSWTFTPNANYNGVINLSYGVSDGVVSTPATQGFTLAAINDAPVLTGTKAVLAAGTEDTAYTITQASLLAGFSDVEGSALSALNLSASNGTLSAFNATTKSWTFTPNANYNGVINLSYGVSDGVVSTPATQSFTLAAINDAPVLTGTKAVLAAGTEDTAYTITQASLLAGFSDVEGSALSALNLSASNGTLSAFNATTKSWTFTPNANYNGVINLSYGVSDGVVSTPATQSFTLAAINDAPTLTAFTATVTTVDEDSEAALTLKQLLAQGNELDIDGTVASFIIKAVSSGSLRIGTSAAAAAAWNATTNNTVDATHLAYWKPALNANGTLNAFTTVVKDNSGAESVTAVQAKVAVTPINDAPTLTAFAAAVATVNEDSVATITLKQLLDQGNEADVDGTISSFVVKAVSSGSLRIGATAWNAITNNTVDATRIAYWTPALNANDTLNAFTAVAKDDSGAESVTAIQAKVAVRAVNDAPTGAVSITSMGSPDRSLTAVNTLVDVDGLGAVTYQWLANGAPITGATSAKLTLGRAQLGKSISVQASYTDGQGSAESIKSTDDVIVQGMSRGSSMLIGGAGIDTVDYSLNGTAGRIVANLATGKVDKVLAGTSADVGAMGRYVRIYHSDGTFALSLTGLKVFSGDIDVAAGKPSRSGADKSWVGEGNNTNNPLALTDGTMGGSFNGEPSNGSNLAFSLVYQDGYKPYIELDLGSVKAVDSIALWGEEDGSVYSNNLRVYVSSTPFSSASTAYNDLAANTAVARVDVASVDTAATATYTDTLTGIENLVGTAFGDTLAGDANNNALFGGAGNDLLSGQQGNDSLDGGSGNDTLAGGAGSDTYLFNRGGGADLIQENDATAGNKDVLRFGSSIDASQVWLSKVNAGKDLRLSIIGSSDSITVSNWYAGSANHVEEIYAGGKKLLDTNVDKLVNAMAAFAPPAAGQTSLPANLQTALQPVIAANWATA